MALFDLKSLNLTLDQLEQEKNIPRESILEAIEDAMAAAYKKDYGKKGQMIRAKFDVEAGDTEFYQAKLVVDDSMVRPEEDDESAKSLTNETEHYESSEEPEEDTDTRPRFNPEQHIYLEDAKKIKSDAELGEEITFPLEVQEDFGRIAAQTAKQVIIQKIREAEKESVMESFSDKQGTIVSGIVQKVERGTAYIDVQGVTGIMPKNEQIPGEYYRQNQRIKAYLYLVEDAPKGVNLRLSRSHPRFIEALFAMESPEIDGGTVEIRSIAREAGSRSKIAVWSNDENLDPIGACVGQKGIRVATVMSELGGEKIDIIPWSDDPGEFVAAALAPAKVLDIDIDESNHYAKIEVADDQLSLAIGKSGQNVRLAAKLTGWKIDIAGVEGEEGVANPEDVPMEESEKEEDALATDSAQEEGAKEASEENEEDAEDTSYNEEHASEPTENKEQDAEDNNGS